MASFSLFDLGQVLNAGAGAVNQYRQQRALGDLGTRLQSGDFEGAAQTALAAGDVGTGLQLLKLGETRKQRDLQRQSDAEIMQTIGGLGMTGGVSAPASAPYAGGAPIAGSGGAEPRGLRNMNPGNIEAGSFTQSQPGYVGSDGRFARFDTLEHGIGAHAALLGRYADKGINTVAGVINRWAPQAENGKATGNYAQFVARKIGVDPNTPIDLSNPDTRQRLAYAMAEFENGRPIGPAQNGQPVQVADASGAIPQSAGGATDGLENRLRVLAGLLGKKGISPQAIAAINAQIQITKDDIARRDKQENLSIQRENIRENRAMRQQQFEATQAERAARRNEASSGNIFKTVEKRTEAATAAAQALPSFQEANRLLNSGQIILGAGADYRLGLQKIGALFGVDSTAASNTETFRSEIAPTVLALVKGLGAGTAISNADREFAEKAAGGRITLEPASIKRLISIGEKASIEKIKEHNKMVDSLYPAGGEHERERTIFRVGGTSVPISEDEFKALPSGAKFTAPDGSVRIKP